MKGWKKEQAPYFCTFNLQDLRTVRKAAKKFRKEIHTYRAGEQKLFFPLRNKRKYRFKAIRNAIELNLKRGK